MGVRTVKIIRCDECNEVVVSDRWVDAGTYGVAFHVDCWDLIGGPRVARVLYLDEIRIRDAEGNEIERAWGPR